MPKSSAPQYLVAVAVTLACLSSAIPSLHGQIRGDAEAISIAAKRHTENRSRLRTWKGTVEIADTIVNAEIGKKAEVQEFCSRVEFACDRKAELVRSNWTYTKSPWPHGLTFHSMLKKPDAICRLGPAPLDDIKGHTVRIFSPKNEMLGEFAVDFDPMNYFKVHRRFMDSRFNFIYANRDKKELSSWTVTRIGSTVRLAYASQKFPLRWLYVSDLSQGGNLVEVKSSSPTLVEHWMYSHERVAGVWVPKQFDHFRTEDSKTSHRKVVWISNKVNVALEANEFSYDKLGAGSGVRVRDNRNGTSQTHEEATKKLKEKK